ncbi:hypothetical protein MDOR_05250 [Mycolicibacterium doricum]|uniref:Uncharacterized protein n=1 Tax=Mycolicibacterium doricum TaxID=126673 RepID=A0A1X1TAV8_9MYCO|nr:hypothetical protein [Mycolicibacterium doricum]MCV7269171.1 hypothetical protein [Mycolicibacterium doricum]ORV41649.1 hypothetical protein AWC01_09580 [Mycolicibacterium doricum]BBZ06356.1 hypothetical protein MDOR_05250 [Mycolicibacterium doricum]
MTSADVGLGFWLRYVEASGGLTEFVGDTTMVMLPSALQTALELPEELHVTADPDVAREDGATLLSAGHPALSRCADEVLAVGDVGALTVPVAATPPPPAEQLQAAARDQFTVEHGRIDANGAPTRSVRAILRVGALVDYTLSSDDHYQECAECWVDVPSQRRLDTQVSTKLAGLSAVPKDDAPLPEDLSAAIRYADRVIEQCAERRRSELGDDIGKARDAELDRVEAYYRDALATLERRREQAPADRRELLDARAESVRSERARRIEETRQKYRASQEIRPYRLHIYEIPVWRLPVDVRRGDRRYPLMIDWLIPLARFADIACPHCGADERLVATKTRLGCTACVPRPTVRLVPEPARPSAKPAAKAQQVVTPPPTPPPTPRPHRPVVRPDPGPRSANPDKVGDKLTRYVWDAVVRRDRRLARHCAPNSPAAAAIRLYGPSGAAWAIGLPPTEDMVAVAAQTTTSSSGVHHASMGYVETAAGKRFPFLLRWQAEGGAGQIDEVLPYDWPFESAYLRRWVNGPGRAGVQAPPPPRVPLGPVGESLWRNAIPLFGLPTVLRCLAALWRLPDEEGFVDVHGPAVLAAGIERLVCRRANLTTGRFADVAVAYGVEEAAVRAADADLQKCLQLGPQRWW